MQLDEAVGYAISRDALEALIRHYGGGFLTVPASPAGAAFETLRSAVGDAAARCLVARVAGCRLFVPCGPHHLREQGAVLVRALVERGLPTKRIVREFAFFRRLSERQVYRLMASDR